MNIRVDHLLNEALHLPADERSALLAALVDSLDGSEDASISEAWRAEVNRRRRALQDGSTTPLPWTEVKARMQAL